MAASFVGRSGGGGKRPTATLSSKRTFVSGRGCMLHVPQGEIRRIGGTYFTHPFDVQLDN